MNKKGLWGIVCLGLLLVLPAAAEDVKDFYFGHISMADIRNDGKDVLVFREGIDRGEPALLNLPIGPGDTIRTSDGRRSEIQFDNGTLIRLDYDTELKVETILAPSLSSFDNVSNIVLKKGRAYIMYTEYDRRELFQILTPNAALKMKNHAVAQVVAAADGSTGIQVDNGKVEILFGPSEKKTGKENIRSGERAVVAADGSLRKAEFHNGTEFEAWNKSLNANFVKTHDGLTPLPKPIQKMPKAIFYFAQNYSNLYGDWIWDQYLGYVWRPFVNDHRYPWGGWQPYYCGQWASLDGRLFWVPQEPWGWIPYHLGVWHWDKKQGWLWIPGSAFAPAWVAWDFYFGQRTWRPWTLWDWYFDMCGYWGWWDYMGYWSYGGWPGGYYPWNYYYDPRPDPNNPSGKTILTTITKDQLKGKTPKVVRPLPKDMKGIYKDFIAAFKRGDPKVIDSFIGTPRQGPVRSVKPISIPVDLRTRLGSSRPFFDKDAIRTVLRDSGLDGRPTPRSGGRGAGGGVSFRFRDWNPDVKIALRAGVSIRYDSRSNQVICPQSGISSRGSDHLLRGDFGSGSSHSSGSWSDGSSSMGSRDSSHSSGSSSHGSSSSGASHGSSGTKKD
ncbi:MAG: FecR family protein [Candidatus Aminicenantes bacterium]|nr:FecR family protein [Candidatus Aminicenantes bacterium]